MGIGYFLKPFKITYTALSLQKNEILAEKSVTLPSKSSLYDKDRP